MGIASLSSRGSGRCSDFRMRPGQGVAYRTNRRTACRLLLTRSLAPRPRAEPCVNRRRAQSRAWPNTRQIIELQRAAARGARRLSMRPRVVGAMMMMVVVAMMRRCRQRDVREKNQRDREADDLDHDSIPNILRTDAPPPSGSEARHSIAQPRIIARHLHARHLQRIRLGCTEMARGFLATVQSLTKRPKAILISA